MARLVKHSKTEPLEIAAGSEAVYICMCGLSATYPYCDGSHSMAEGEEAGKLHWYDKEGFRNDAEEDFSSIRGLD